MNKRGMEVSVSMIIILIISILTLVIAVAFFTDIFGKLKERVNDFPTIDVEPTADDPIRYLPLELNRGKQNKMSISFYNNEEGDITNDIKPLITCENIAEVSVSASGLEIPIGSLNTYRAIVNIPKDTPSGVYSCTVSISNTQKTDFIEVK